MACGWRYDRDEGSGSCFVAACRSPHKRRKAAGILVPSFAVAARPDMCNLVLWKWGPDSTASGRRV